LYAIGKFLPKRGLTLQSTDGRVRWTDRLLVVAAMLLPWQVEPKLKDAFEACWHVVTGMYPTRRRVGYTYEGFSKALVKHSSRLLSVVAPVLRKAVQKIAGKHWKIEGWLVMGVDGSRINCPRTAANEAAFGCAGKVRTGPQQFITTLLHVGTGLIWNYRRGGGKEAERNHLRQMIPTLPPKALLLADAGFTGYDLLQGLVSNGTSFIIRAGNNVRLLKKLDFRVREHDNIVYLWPKIHRGYEPLMLRLAVVHDGRKPVYLLTNVLDTSLLSDAQIGAMYRRRWGLEVFYRSFKRIMEKHMLRSASPKQAEVELDWALVGLWLLGLMSVERMIRSGKSPSCWSVATSLRIVRRVMAGRGGRRAARDLRALATATKDSYCRRSSKTARNWPHKKKDKPPKPPIIRMATREERQAAQRFKAENTAA